MVPGSSTVSSCQKSFVISAAPLDFDAALLGWGIFHRLQVMCQCTLRTDLHLMFSGVTRQSWHTPGAWYTNSPNHDRHHYSYHAYQHHDGQSESSRDDHPGLSGVSISAFAATGDVWSPPEKEMTSVAAWASLFFPSHLSLVGNIHTTVDTSRTLPICLHCDPPLPWALSSPTSSFANAATLALPPTRRISSPTTRINLERPRQATRRRGIILEQPSRRSIADRLRLSISSRSRSRRMLNDFATLRHVLRTCIYSRTTALTADRSHPRESSGRTCSSCRAQ